jgi:glycosyltransferase involved in cell wall biosynthesis
LSIVVPSLGSAARFAPFLDALARQTLPRDRFELIVAFDGATVEPELTSRLERAGARTVALERRAGPPATRNRAAALAGGEFLVLTEDDVAPEPRWLECIANHLAADPSLDVIEGITLKPGGRPVRRRAMEAGLYILTNIVVRRSLYERVGGCHEQYFDPATGVFFREDTDLGWKLENAGARVLRADDVIVVHPEENPRWLDPLRWTRRYLMDGLLAARFPREFRERIEVHHLGPLLVRRPIVRASMIYVVSLLSAAFAALTGHNGLAAFFVTLAALCFLPVWAKWRFDLLRLPVFLMVPFGLVSALIAGHVRARRLGARPVAAP